MNDEEIEAWEAIRPTIINIKFNGVIVNFIQDEWVIYFVSKEMYNWIEEMENRYENSIDMEEVC